jgi:hypothetical protein
MLIENVKDLAGNIMSAQNFQFQFVGIEDFISDGQLNVFPNPADKLLNVSFNSKNNSSVNLLLTDINGKNLITSDWPANSGENKFTIDLSSYSKGLYLLKITVNGESMRFKVMKQ